RQRLLEQGVEAVAGQHVARDAVVQEQVALAMPAGADHLLEGLRRAAEGQAQLVRLLSGPGDVLSGGHLVLAAGIARVEQGPAVRRAGGHRSSPGRTSAAWRWRHKKPATAAARASSSASPRTRSASHSCPACQAKWSSQTRKTP